MKVVEWFILHLILDCKAIRPLTITNKDAWVFVFGGFIKFHFVFDFAGRCADDVGLWSNKAEDDRQDDQPLKETKHDDQEEDLEEWAKDVRLGICQQNKGQEGADSSVHDGRSNVGEGLADSFLSSRTVFDKKSVSNVGTVVNAEAYGDDDVDAGHCVDGETPEVHETSDVDEWKKHHEQHHEWTDEVADENEGCDEDAQYGQAEISIQLLCNDLICFPPCIALGQGEYFATQICISYDLFHPVHCRYVLAWSAEYPVSERHVAQENFGRLATALQVPIKSKHVPIFASSWTVQKLG